jgi:hypothetical protein
MNENLMLVKVGLVIATIAGLSYGITLMLVPSLWVTISGSEPLEPAWVRWAGGGLIAVSIGNIMVFRRPAGQGIYVTMLALFNLLNAVGHLITQIAQDFSGAGWVVALPMAITFVTSVILWWGHQQAKETLRSP